MRTTIEDERHKTSAETPSEINLGRDFFVKNYDSALCLARMLSYAADEAKELEAIDCQLLINLALRDLKEQLGLKYDDIIEMSPELN